MSPAELLLEVHLREAGIPFQREFRFAPEDWCREQGFVTPTGRARKWRADFLIRRGTQYTGPSLLIEIDGGGYIAGRHSRGVGMEQDAAKQSAAAILGYRVVRCTPKQVDSMECVTWIKAALGQARREAA